MKPVFGEQRQAVGSLLTLGLALITLGGGCRSKEAENENAASTGKPFAGLTLDVSVPDGLGLPTAWQLSLSEWSGLTSAECRLHEYPPPENAAEFPEVLTTSPKNSDSMPGVFLVPWSAIPELAASGHLAEIPTALQGQEQLDWIDVFHGLRRHAASVSQRPLIVPVSCPVLVCYYRRDLLEKAGLDPPETWADYQRLLESLDVWAAGLVAMEPWAEPNRATTFLARAAATAKHPGQFSFELDVSTGEPLIDNPGFVESLKAAQAALALMPEAVKTASPADCRLAILEGRAALAIGYEMDRDQNATRGENVQVGVCPLPGAARVYNTANDEWAELGRVHRVTLAGFAGWGVGVSAGLDAANRQAAWELVRYLTIDHLPSSYPPAVVSPCRDSQLALSAEWTGPLLTTVEREDYLLAVGQTLRNDQFVMELPFVGHSQFRDALTTGLTTALAPDANPQAVLQSVAQTWRTLRDDLGQQQVLDSYRRSKGLSSSAVSLQGSEVGERKSQ